MRTVSSKVDNTIHEQILNRCNGIGCSPSQYIKDLIARDLQASPGSNHNQTEGTSVKSAPKARTVIIDPSETELKKAGGIVDVYKNGKLAYTKIPPREAGGQWTYRLYR